MLHEHSPSNAVAGPLNPEQPADLGSTKKQAYLTIPVLLDEFQEGLVELGWILP